MYVFIYVYNQTCMCIYMHITDMYAYMYVYVSMQIGINVCRKIHVSICMYVCTEINMYAHIYMYVWYLCMHICNVYVCTFMSAYHIHLCIITYSHMHTIIYIHSSVYIDQ